MTDRPVQTARIAGAAWSFGYLWQSATSPATLKPDAAREAALPSVEADVLALRPDTTHAQFGLGYLAPEDRARGMVAAIGFATEQAKATIRTAIGLFEIPGGYWTVVVDKDLIAHDGDRVHDTLEQALAAIGERLISREWAKIYLPHSLIDESTARADASRAAGDDIDEFDVFVAEKSAAGIIGTTPLADLLRGARAPYHQQRKIRGTDMRAVLLSRPAMLGAVAALTAALTVFVGLPLYRSFTSPPPLVVAALPAPPPPAPPPPVIDTPPPSIGQPSAAAWLTTCFDQMAGLDDAAPPGWDDMILDCQASRASLQLNRGQGRLQALENAYPGALLSYDANYDHATVSKVLTMAAPPRVESLAPAEELRRRLFQFGWSTREKIIVEPFAIPPGRQPADRATWKQAGFTIISPTDLEQWASALDHVPGVTITSVTADAHLMKSEPTKFHWEIKGLLYAE
jgi:hypothetical protein